MSLSNGSGGVRSKSDDIEPVGGGGRGIKKKKSDDIDDNIEPC